MNTINQQIQEIIRQQKSLQSALDRCVKELAEKEPSVSETQQQDLSKVISQADLNGLEIKDHYMASFDSYRKNRYAFLLIALLKEVSVVLSEDQYVLLRLLLQSMQLNHELSYYFEGNTVIDDQFLLDFKEKIEGKEVAQALMTDLMMIARINGTFDQQALQTLSELMSFFEIEESVVKEMDQWMACLLGLSRKIHIKQEKIYDNWEPSSPVGSSLEASIRSIMNMDYRIVNDVKTGYVGADCKILGIEYYKSDSLRLYGGLFSNTTSISDDKPKLFDNKTILSSCDGYFLPRVSNDQRLENGNILLGIVFKIPECINFWYSFIDLEKVIKENK